MSLNVTLTNGTSFGDDEIYWVCYGLDGSGLDAHWSYVTLDASKKASLKQFTKKTDCGSIFNTIKDFPSFSDLPELWSGQFLFCFGEKPKMFNVVTTSTPDTYHGLGIQTPPFVPNSADQYTNFVVVEFTYSGAISCDCTIVDYFCAPVEIEVVGANHTKTNGQLKSGKYRDDIFTAISNLGAPWSNLIMKNKAGTKNIRVLAPQHGVKQGFISTSYFDDYVNAVWDNFKKSTGNKLTVTTTYGTFQGQVDEASGDFHFHQVEANGTLNTNYFLPLPKPGPDKAYDIFGCVGTLNAPNQTAIGAIAAIIGAGFNRSVIKISGDDNQPQCTLSDFYSPVDSATNEYAKVIHHHYSSGIYAFPFDDVCSTDSPLINESSPEQFNITLSAWEKKK